MRFTAETHHAAWDAVAAMAALDIIEEPFEHLQGDPLGYARARSIGLDSDEPAEAQDPVSRDGACGARSSAVADMHDDEALTRQIEEAEAEGVAYLLCALLDLPGQAEAPLLHPGLAAGRKRSREERQADLRRRRPNSRSWPAGAALIDHQTTTHQEQAPMASQDLTPEALEGFAAQLDGKPAHEALPALHEQPRRHGLAGRCVAAEDRAPGAARCPDVARLHGARRRHACIGR